MVFVVMDLMAQHYFVMEPRGSARPTLGKRDDAGRNNRIVNKQ